MSERAVSKSCDIFTDCVYLSCINSSLNNYFWYLMYQNWLPAGSQLSTWTFCCLWKKKACCSRTCKYCLLLAPSPMSLCWCSPITWQLLAFERYVVEFHVAFWDTVRRLITYNSFGKFSLVTVWMSTTEPFGFHAGVFEGPKFKPLQSSALFTIYMQSID